MTLVCLQIGCPLPVFPAQSNVFEGGQRLPTLKGGHLALPTSLRLSQKSLPGINTLAYYKLLDLRNLNKILGPGAVFTALYFIRNIQICTIKLECLSLLHFPFQCNITLQLTAPILKLRSKYSPWSLKQNKLVY